MESSPTRDHTFVSSELISGSNDFLRNHLQGCYSIVEDENSSELSFTEFEGYVFSQGDVIASEYNSVVAAVHAPEIATTGSSLVIFPTIKIPYRIVGNTDNMVDDEMWRAKLLGGVYGTASYEGVLNDGTFNSSRWSLSLPYELLDLKAVVNEEHANYESCVISYEYNYYFPEYQEHVDELSSEMYIPNFYDMLIYPERSGLMNENMRNFISVEDTAFYEKVLFEPQRTKYIPLYDLSDNAAASRTVYMDKTINFKSYVTSSVVPNALSSSTERYLDEAGQNLLFSSNSQHLLFDKSITNNVSKTIPFMTKLTIPVSMENDLSQLIQESGYSEHLLAAIKNVFVNGIPESYSYAIQEQKVAFDSNDNISNISNVSNLPLNGVNFYDLILGTLQNADIENPLNFKMMGGLDSVREELINRLGFYRYHHTLPALRMLNSLNDYLVSSGLFLSETYLGDGKMHLSEMLNLANQKSHSSVVAYRVSKSKNINGNMTPIQNFIFYNGENISNASDDLNKLVFYDSQVKYGETYQYDVYAYVMIISMDYRYSDIRLTKQLAAPSDLSDDYCLQFYDSKTFEPAAELFGPALHDSSLWEFESSVISGSFIENTLISSEHPYMADFNLSFEPSVRLIEVPVLTKPITVLDSPPSAIDITPFQRMNNSQIIGFYAQHESYAPAKMSEPLASSEIVYAQNYSISNNLLFDDKVPNRSVSKPIAVRIYRMTTRPQTITDFSQHFIKEKTLDIKGSSFKMSNCFYEEKVPTNQKIYYLFKFINENEVVGHGKTIYECELKDDGGYKYALFNTLTESDLASPTTTEPSTPFKKLIQFLPITAQVTMDDTNIDYEKNAHEEYDNFVVGQTSDSIFGKKFKFRLTSRKTGEKIDINVVYNVKDI